MSEIQKIAAILAADVVGYRSISEARLILRRGIWFPSQQSPKRGVEDAERDPDHG